MNKELNNKEIENKEIDNNKEINNSDKEKKKSFHLKSFILGVLFTIFLLVILLFSIRFIESFMDTRPEEVVAKPVIYLYPENDMEVSVGLDYSGDLTYTYPEYDNGWSVIAKSDGVLIDKDGKEYSYLFWEGESDIDYEFSKGFCVKGEDTIKFLQEKLSEIGLIPKEYNEFIVYWLPKMQDNKYNLISFQSDIYTENAKLDITPTPDNLLRVFMAFKPIEEFVDIEPQIFDEFSRNGFTVVEWGGTEVN